MNEPKPKAPPRHRKMPTLGQRVPADTKKKFSEFARTKVKCKAAELLRALIEATVNGKATLDSKGLTVNVNVSGGATREEVAKLLADAFAKFAPGKASVALADAVPTSKIPARSSNGRIIIPRKLTSEEAGLVEGLGAVSDRQTGFHYIPEGVDAAAFERFFL